MSGQLAASMVHADMAGLAATNTTIQCTPAVVEVSALGIALGSVLSAATLFVPLPQIIKMVRLKNSQGLEVMTLCLVLLYSWSNLAAMIAVKWRQFSTYASHGVGVGLAQQLDLLQGIFSIVDWSWILGLVIMLPPNNTLQKRCLAFATLTLSLAMFTTILLLSIRDACSERVLWLAKIYGDISGLCTVVAFLPQLVTTWRNKGAGSLSFVFTGIQVVGCYTIAADLCLVNLDPYPVWAPTATSGTMQLLILVMAIYYHLVGPGSTAAVVSSAHEGLLDGRQPSSADLPYEPYVPTLPSPEPDRPAAPSGPPVLSSTGAAPSRIAGIN